MIKSEQCCVVTTHDWYYHFTGGLELHLKVESG